MNSRSRSGALSIFSTAATLARRFASLSRSHDFQPVRKLPSARPFVSLMSFDRGKTMATTRTTDICLPKPQLRVPASRALPVPRQDLRPGGENGLWGTFSMPEILAFHDAKIALVGNGFSKHVFWHAFSAMPKRPFTVPLTPLSLPSIPFRWPSPQAVQIEGCRDCFMPYLP